MANSSSKENKDQKIHTSQKRTFFQAKLTVNSPEDQFEREADSIAEKVVSMEGNDSNVSQIPVSGVSPGLPNEIQQKCESCEVEEKVQMKGNHQGSEVNSDIENDIQTAKSGGNPLPTDTQISMESCFGKSFQDVKIHHDADSNQLNKKLNARAFTTGNNIFFKSGEYNPKSKEGKKLLAHELTHTVQQTHGKQQVQRTVELRPPGRGEASAFERRQEMVDRLNTLSNAVSYTLNGRVLEYEVVEGADQTFFDRNMIAFIDSTSVIPLRLITGAGLVGSRASGFSSLLIDSFMSGYLDLEDLMNSDDTSFQMNLLHILTERSRARNYDRRIGTAGLSPIDAAGNLTPEFRRAHLAGNNAEASFLQDIFNDPTIRFVRERERGRNLIFTFRSDEGYRIIHTFRRQDRNISGGSVEVINAAGDTVSVDDFIQERAAVAP